eukprot:SAG22_NODE_13012_length_421_cov_2.481366_1_plen_55_part_01
MYWMGQDLCPETVVYRVLSEGPQDWSQTVLATLDRFLCVPVFCTVHGTDCEFSHA